MKATPQDRVSQHLALMVGNLEKLMERPPRSYDALECQHLFSDAAVGVALIVVCDLLPPEVQPTVKRLLELRQGLWARGVVTEQEAAHE
jgi:hypothetical protein